MMAIKIVKTEPAKEVIKQVVCRKCGVTLEYLPVDIKKGVHYDYGGGSDDVFWIDCPQCQTQINVKPGY